MEFITSGDRIATENFSIGKVYTVTFTNGNYFINTCVGIGPDFVMFQQEAPKMLFCLDMESAETVSSIDESGGGAGTTNYNELNNKPSINGVTLVGNKTAADLSILPVPIVGENDNNKILTASYSGGVGSYSWQPAPSSGTTDYTQLTNKPQINSVELNGNKSLADLGIASAEALAGKQDVISDLSTIRSGAAAGATAVQPATLANYQPLIDSSHKLAPALVATDTNNRFATDTQLNQIETNKTNILTLYTEQSKNIIDTDLLILATLNPSFSRNDNVFTIDGTLTITVNSNGKITVTGSIARAVSFILINGLDTSYSGYILSGGTASISIICQTDGSPYTAYATSTSSSGMTVSAIPSDKTARVVLSVLSDTYNNVELSPMLCSSTTWAMLSGAYQPFALSNAELTTAIRAIQAQLANT